MIASSAAFIEVAWITGTPCAGVSIGTAGDDFGAVGIAGGNVARDDVRARCTFDGGSGGADSGRPFAVIDFGRGGGGAGGDCGGGSGVDPASGGVSGSGDFDVRVAGFATSEGGVGDGRGEVAGGATTGDGGGGSITGPSPPSRGS